MASSVKLIKQRGFTLVELVTVIVLLGVVAAASTQFVRQGVEIYVDSTRRDSLQQQGRFTVERISRELRHALPGSVRTLDNCIEFAPIVAASSYTGHVADFAATNFQAMGFDYVADANRRVAVYTIENDDVYGNTSNSVVGLASVAGGDEDIQRQINLSTAHRFSTESPSQRFYIVTRPVSFCVRGSELFKHQAYGWFTAQPTSTADIGGGVLLAEHIQTTEGGNPVTVFQYTAGTLQRAGVTHLDLRLRDATEPDEWVRFSQEIFVRNVP